ncbi:unnamed protein product [Cylicocyclus nassatus]|uniref:Cyclic nucleotide-binding domain-containing protein n=1 Tax=Cylicocyclus nassatus TaxID=53992 RepID=A0AA36H029_CYLNA|nr:unnamed protein product [Cylicocyclus nassatus]
MQLSFESIENKMNKQSLGRAPRKSITPFSEFDIENQFIKWKALHPTVEYDISVNPKGSVYWYWSCIVSSACFYNLIFITMLVFEDIRNGFYSHWITGNIICDVIYIIDMWFQSRLMFYEHGCKVTEMAETRSHYLSSSRFMIDVLSLLPTDLFLYIQYDASVLRLNRLLKCYRLLENFDLAQGRLTQAFISLMKIIISCALIFHWNACAFYIISTISDTTSWDEVNATFDDDDGWPWPYMPEKITDVHFADCSHFEQTCDYRKAYLDEEREAHLMDLYHYWENRTIKISFSTFTKAYTVSMYWSALTMTTLGEQPSPNETIQSVFEILDTIIGMVIFAGIMGSVGDLVEKANRVKAEWQQRMDGLKQFMTYRNLHAAFQRRVLKYCEYEMAKQEKMTEEEMRETLPPKLYTQVNKYMQWTTLTTSPLFESCETPFLRDLAGYLEPRDYGPGDVVCARGELNKEMLIVASGYLSVVDPKNFTLRTYREGDVIEDSSIVWFPNNRYRNRRKYNVISIGYSQVYILFRDDLLRIWRDYPKCRENIRVKAEYLQSQAGDLIEENCCLDCEMYEESTLEERLIAMRSVINLLEESVDENYEKFKKKSSRFRDPFSKGAHPPPSLSPFGTSTLLRTRMYTFLLVLAFATTTYSLTCYEGILQGLENNTRVEEKHCSPMSNYCVQKIDKKKNQIIRECSSFADEHNMEEKCPMTGCHWQSAHETFCCCQFDGCNEWKSDGTEYRKGETIPPNSLEKPKPSIDDLYNVKPTPAPKPAYPSLVNTASRKPKLSTGEINLD